MRIEDSGTTHTLEAMIIATIMVAAVAFVATFESPAGATVGSRGVLEQHTRDTLNILGDEPLEGSPLGSNLMSVALMECLQGDCARMQDKLTTLLPKGASYAVYLSNGYGSYPVYAARSPPGEAVAASRLFEPSWSYAFVGAAVSSVNPVEDPLVMYVVPVVDSNVLAPEGNILDVVVHGTRVGDSADYILRTSVATRAALSSASAQTPAASLYFVDASGNAIASLDARATTTLGGVATRTPLPVTLRLNETAGVAIPAGAQVTVHLPRGWNASAPAGANAADWTIAADALDHNGSASGADVLATLTHALAGGKADLKLNLTYLGDQDDDYVLRASASRGAFAEAALLVAADKHVTSPAFEVPGVYLSAPKPMGATAPTTWTLAGFVPTSSTATTSDSVRVTEIDITEEKGAPIFGGVSGISSAGGSWSANTTSLVWRGNTTLSHWSPMNLTFSVTGSGLAGNAEERGTFVPSMAFENWSARVGDATSPGVFRQAVLPSDLTYRGYNSSTGAWLLGNHTTTSDSVYRSIALPGTMAYSTGYVSGLQDSVFGSDLNVNTRSVPVGGTLSLTANVQSLAYQLAALGLKPVIKLNVFPPWTADNRTPIYTQTLFDAPKVLGNATLLSAIDTNGDGTPDPTNLGKYNVSVPVPQAWLFGGYVLDVELDWSDAVSGTIGGASVNAPLVRTAHIYDHFEVTPPNGVLPASPVYTVKLLTWFDDWR